MTKRDILDQLQAHGWKIEAGGDWTFQLPPDIAIRYPKLPAFLVEFLSGLSLCANSTETTWFLCQSDYEGRSNSAFRWHEWEQMSLNAANGDSRDVAEIRKFWDSHFPFLFSVHSGYAFHAVCTSSTKFGEIVAGYEPAFEEAISVAETFEKFLTMLANGTIAI
jgi:hypothetical protein